MFVKLRLAVVVVAAMVVVLVLIGVWADAVALVAGAAIATLLLVLVCLSGKRIEWTVILLGYFAAFPLPLALPQQFSLAGGSVFVVDLLSVLLLVLLLSLTGAARMNVWLLVAVVVFLGGAAVGLAVGGDLSAAIRDIRGPLEVATLTCGIVATMRRGGAGSRLMYLRALIVLVVGTALILVFETLTGAGIFDLRSQDAVLYLGHNTASYAATRLTPPGDLLCSVAGASAVVLWLQQRVPARGRWWLWALAISGLFVGLVNLSRNNLIAIVVVVLVGLLTGGGQLTVLRRLLPLLIAASLAGATGLMLIATYAPRIHTILTNTADAFVGRVIVGLDPDTLAVDSSAQWRVRESSAALSSLARDHGLGTGLGVAYRGILPGDPFTDGSGVYYLHNSYLWLPVKLGIVPALIALVLLIVLVLRLVPRAWGRNASLPAALSFWTVCALLPVMAVTPQPFSRNGAVVCAVAFGLAVMSVQRRGVGADGNGGLVVPEAAVEKKPSPLGAGAGFFAA